MFKGNLFLVFGLMFFLGCASAPPEPVVVPPTLLNLQISATPNTNPDGFGKAQPVLLRIYELREQSNFSGADFFSVFDKEQATLAADLVKKQEFLLTPGENKSLSFETAADTRFIGIFSAFRLLDTAQWRVIAPLVLHQNNVVKLSIDKNQLILNQEPKTQP